jgi:succinyl-CoA synthetase alpha subunit
LDEDDRTDVIVLVGEIGGDSEEAAAQYIIEAIDKPVVAYLAGCFAPIDKPLGHAGAIIAAQLYEATQALATQDQTEIGTAASKLMAFKRAKVPVATTPSQIPILVKKAIQKLKRPSS